MRTLHHAAVVIASLAGAIGTGACVTSGATSCGDLVCPAGTTCAPNGGGRCYDNDLVDSCRGLDDGDACEVPGLPPGTCQGGVCQTSRCGDNRVTGSEQCDGADFDGITCQGLGFYERPGIACTSSCTYDTAACVGRCGDGVRNGPEMCDSADLGNQSCLDAGFYAAPGLACASDCSFDTAACGGGSCGDGVVNGFEQCDSASFSAASCSALGYMGAMNGLVCSNACTYHASSCSCAVGHCNAYTQRCECSKTGCACVTM